MIQPVPTIGVQNFGQVPDGRRERRRKLMVRLVFAIYWLLIFEGVLRKWVVPQFNRELFFIRDPLVVWVYLLALSGRMRPQRSVFLIVGLVFSVICLPLVVLQFASSPYIHSWLLSAYGWRNYFFYFPLAFLIARYFRPQDFEYLMRWTLILVIPIALIVYVQFRSPSTAPINQGIGTGEGETYSNGGYALGLVRTYGTFTSSTGQTVFTGSVMAMLLAAWLRPKAKRPLQGVLLVAATGAGVTCLALSGSRGAMVEVGIIFAASIPAVLLMAGRSLAFQKIFIPILVVAVGAILATAVFPLAVEAITSRWRSAGYTENQAYGAGGIFGRAVYDLGSFRFLLASTPPQGYQLGLGGNAAGVLSGKGLSGESYYDPRLLSFGRREEVAVESDWGRQIIELGGTLGLLFIAFRVAFVIWLGKEAVGATVRSGDPLPLLLFVFIGIHLFGSQITGHGTVNGYAWLFAGFCMSINRRSGTGLPGQVRSLQRFKLTPRTGGLGRPQVAHS
jgi:hypothetical protein